MIEGRDKEYNEQSSIIRTSFMKLSCYGENMDLLNV